MGHPDYPWNMGLKKALERLLTPDPVERAIDRVASVNPGVPRSEIARRANGAVEDFKELISRGGTNYGHVPGSDVLIHKDVWAGLQLPADMNGSPSQAWSINGQIIPIEGLHLRSPEQGGTR